MPSVLEEYAKRRTDFVQTVSHYLPTTYNHCSLPYQNHNIPTIESHSQYGNKRPINLGSSSDSAKRLNGKLHHSNVIFWVLNHFLCKLTVAVPVKVPSSWRRLMVVFCQLIGLKGPGGRHPRKLQIFYVTAILEILSFIIMRIKSFDFHYLSSRNVCTLINHLESNRNGIVGFQLKNDQEFLNGFTNVSDF